MQIESPWLRYATMIHPEIYKKLSKIHDLTDQTSREMWDTWDPTLISEVNISMNTIWGNFYAMGGILGPSQNARP